MGSCWGTDTPLSGVCQYVNDLPVPQLYSSSPEACLGMSFYPPGRPNYVITVLSLPPQVSLISTPMLAPGIWEPKGILRNCIKYKMNGLEGVLLNWI